MIDNTPTAIHEENFTTPLPIRQVRITDPFWQREIALVREKMLPYQFEALNDRVRDAAPSYCIHNFRAAARLQAKRRAGETWHFPVWPGTFETLPGEGKEPDPDAFYGFVFQDSDLYKWLEAVSYSLMQCPDPELEKEAQEAAELVCAAQEPDGYLDTFYILKNREGAFSNLKDHHELYCLGHLTEAAVAWHQATGRDNLLRAAERFADCVAAHIGKGGDREPGYPGHEIAEMALLRLYEETGEKRFLEQSRYFVSQRGEAPHYFLKETNREREKQGKAPLGEEEAERLFAYYQAHVPVKKQREAVGHAVRAMYLYSGMADMARLDRDGEMLESCRALWRSTVREKMYITGGVGGTHIGESFSRPFDLPNDTAYSETCAAVGLVFFARRMLQLSPESAYGDVMERALNTVLSGMAMDGQSFFYVNPLEVVPSALKTDKRLEHVKGVRQKWFGCACCPPNVARLLTSISQYALTVRENAVYVHLYMDMDASLTLGGSPLRLKVTGDWMHGGLHMTVETDKEGAEGRIAVRLPGWCLSPKCTSSIGEGTVEKGYAVFTGRWHTGDTLDLSIPLVPRLMQADARVAEDADRAAVQYGPFVMCAEEADNGKDLALLRLDAQKPAFSVGEVEIGGCTLPCVSVHGRKTVPRQSDELYTDYAPLTEEETTVRLVPYFAWGNRGEGEMRVWLRT